MLSREIIVPFDAQAHVRPAGFDVSAQFLQQVGLGFHDCGKRHAVPVRGIAAGTG